MQVVDHDLRANGKELLVQGDVFLELLEGVEMIEVAEVVAEEGVAAAAQGKRPLELATDRKNGPRNRKGQPDRLPRVAPRAPQRQLQPSTTRVTESSQRTWIGRS